MKILVLGVYFANNLGDAVICDSTASLLRHILPEAEIIIKDIKNRHEFAPTKKLSMKQVVKSSKRACLRHLVTKLQIWDKEKEHEEYRLSSSIKYIEETCDEYWDLVVFAGGQIFQDGFALFIDAFIERFNHKGIPVIFFSCGTGPTWSSYVSYRLSIALQSSCVKWISTRDNKAMIDEKYLHNSGKLAMSVSDPALWCDFVYQIKKQPLSDVVGLGVMYAENIHLNIQTKFWIDTITLLDKKKIKWKIFVNGSNEDICYAKYIVSKLTKKISGNVTENEVHWQDIEVPHFPRELVSTVSKFKSIISFRLHSHVIASALGIPGIAMVWDEKLQFFYEKLGYPQRCMNIRADPENVIVALQTAELQGTDLLRVREQRVKSYELLKSEIYNVLGLENR